MKKFNNKIVAVATTLTIAATGATVPAANAQPAAPAANFSFPGFDLKAILNFELPPFIQLPGLQQIIDAILRFFNISAAPVALPAAPAAAAPAVGGAEANILNDINAYRASLGLAPVSFDAQLAASAQSYAQQLAATNSFDHSGQNLFENLYFTSSSPANALNAWRNSPTHDSVLRAPDMHRAGIGIAPGSLDGNSGFFVVLQGFF